MDPGPLDVLEDPADKDPLPVGDRVELDLVGPLTNLVITTGCWGETRAASWRNRARSVRAEMTRIACPLST